MSQFTGNALQPNDEMHTHSALWLVTERRNKVVPGDRLKEWISLFIDENL